MSKTIDETTPLVYASDSLLDYLPDAAIENHTDNVSDDGSSSTTAGKELSNSRLSLILGSIWVGVFFTALDTTIVATLLAPISASFSSLSALSWLASAYLIANAASQPLSGRLTDIFGRRAGLLFGNVAFGAGTLLCGLAPKLWVLLLGRVIAGLGGGALMSITTFMASDLVPLRKRGVVQGINNIAVGIGTGSGGFLGGWINNVLGWRWAFLVQVPFVGIATLLVVFVVKLENTPSPTPKSGLRRIDYHGSVALLIALVSLLIGLNCGGNVVPWTHPLVIVTLTLSAPSLLAFIYIEEKIASEPIIPVRLLLSRTVSSVCLTYLFANMAAFAILYYIPIYLQLLGQSTTEAGLRLIPQSAGTALGALVAGAIVRASGRYYHLNFVVQAISTLAYVLMSTLTTTSASWLPFIYLGLAGLGYGGMLVVALLALVSAVDHEHQATITSASFAFRSIGSTLGVTVASAVFQNLLRWKLRTGLGVEEAKRTIGRLEDSFGNLRDFPFLLRQKVVESYMTALHAVFILALAFGTTAGLMSFRIREHKLGNNLPRR